MKELSLYEKIPIRLEKRNYNYKFTNYITENTLHTHWHEHIEMLYFRSGSCTFYCDDDSFTVQCGDLVFINSTEVHHFVVNECVDYFCLILYPDFFQGMNLDAIKIENHIGFDKFIDECMTNINVEYLTNSVGSDLMIKSYANSLVAYLMRNHPSANAQVGANELHATNLKRLNMVFEYITDNYNKKISTSDLAKLCYLSENYFCRIFKTATGKSFTNYINEYRIEKAAMLLKNTTDNISKIADYTGFNDINYFSRTFKKIKKVSPMEYRKSR